jgi:hypothetical protein
MAALATQNISAGGAYTVAAAAGGGDTAESGFTAGGWGSNSFLNAVIGGTATTITIAGTAYGPFTSVSVMLPISGAADAMGGRVNITYNQVTGVTVGVLRTGGALTGVTFGT